jgi:hypothetical protein
MLFSKKIAALFKAQNRTFLNWLDIILKKGGKKSYFVLYILYTDKTFAKESKSHGFYTYKQTTETKLPELVKFNFG